MSNPTVTQSDDQSKFRGKYRIASTRCAGWNYGSPGWYFVTFCTKFRVRNLSRIDRGSVFLTEIGCVVDEEWQKTPHIRGSVELGPYVVMPDHLHGLIHLTDGSENLGLIVNQVKSNATKRIRAFMHPKFAWQARYHDRIIRDQAEFDRICRYIWNNPRHWKEI